MPGFLKPLPALDNPSGDGLNYVLRGPLYYRATDGRLWRICPGATTDGPSIPQWLQGVIAANGPAYLPGVLHDGLWRGFAEVKTEERGWRRSIPEFEESTRLFEEALINNGMSHAEALVLYLAVMQAGGEARLEDMALPIPPLKLPIADAVQPDDYVQTFGVLAHGHRGTEGTPTT